MTDTKADYSGGGDKKQAAYRGEEKKNNSKLDITNY